MLDSAVLSYTFLCLIVSIAINKETGKRMATTHDAPTSMTTRNRGRKLPMTVISTLSGVRPQKDAAHPPKYMREGALLRKKKANFLRCFALSMFNITSACYLCSMLPKMFLSTVAFEKCFNIKNNSIYWSSV